MSDGSFATASFRSATMPVIGALRSNTALTDSISPNGWPAVTAAPTLGSCKCVTSVSWSTAYWVMPTVHTSPWMSAHSWEGRYLSFDWSMNGPQISGRVGVGFAD